MTMIADLVQQVSTTTGVGNFQLNVLIGRRTFFSAFGAAPENKFFYCINHRAGGHWETGIGYLMANNLLVRETIIESSNNNLIVNFPAGEKDVVNDVAASRLAIVPEVLNNGDIFFYNTAEIQKLPIGTEGQVLTSVSGLPAWSNSLRDDLTQDIETLDEDLTEYIDDAVAALQDQIDDVEVDVAALVAAQRSIATTPQALAGADDTTIMTPLKTKQLVTQDVKLVFSELWNSTSGTQYDFTIPAGTKKIKIVLNGVSTKGTNTVMFQLGTTGGIENTGYTGTSTTAISGVATVTMSAGFLAYFQSGDTAANTRNGIYELINIDDNTWVFSGVAATSTSTGYTNMSAGFKTLGDALTTLRVTTTTGVNTFDAGKVKLIYES